MSCYLLQQKTHFPFSQKYDEILDEIMEGRARILGIDPELRLITPDENYLKNIKRKEEMKDLIEQKKKRRGPPLFVRLNLL